MKTKVVKVEETVVESTVESKESKILELETLKTKLENELKSVVQELKDLKGTKQRVNKGVGEYVRNLIKEGLTNIETLKKVHEHYGNDNTTYACVAWYKNDMISKGLIVK